MNKGISDKIRKILESWSTISDVMDNLPPEEAKEETVMQIISRMKRNGEAESRRIDLYGRTVNSYRLKQVDSAQKPDKLVTGQP